MFVQTMDKSRPHCRYGGIQEKPSFSSTLLDTIYRSIDENGSTMPNIKHPCESPRNSISLTSQNQIRYASSEKGSKATMNGKVFSRQHTFTSTASSYSDSSSSYSGFSSSDTDTVLRSARITMPAAIARSGPLESKKTRGGSIARKLRELRTRAPVSPGARLTSFLNALFTPRRTAKSDHSPCLAASRPCLSKTGSLRERLPSGGSRRSVRFDPVSVKYLHDMDSEALAPARHRQVKETVEEMLLRNFDDDDENDEVGSESSSDLFELENLNAGFEAGRGELPVFETTHLRLAPSMRV